MAIQKLHLPFAVLLLACGILVASSIGYDSGEEAVGDSATDPFTPIRFDARSARGQIVLRGTTTSADHERMLSEFAMQHFKGREMRADFVPGILIPAHWESTSLRLLYVLAATESAEATMQPDAILIRGVTADAETYASRLDFLRQRLVDGVSLSSDVVSVNASTSFEELCSRSFAALALGPVAFHESSSEIRNASTATLDRLVDFANDCPVVRIAITGHTDDSGNQFNNRQLSLDRAQAVADYMAAKGIDTARLSVAGRGAAEPIADNATILGREKNRRIEFELR